MPSFFEGMKRLAQGKPVFSETDGHPQNDGVETPEEYGQQPVSASGKKIIPTVVVKDVEYRMNNENMELDVTLLNSSDIKVELDKIRLLSTTYELDRGLNPGESREFTVYRGPMPTNTHDTRCEVIYRDPSGDYFSAIHYMEYDQQSNGRWAVNQMRFIPPVKDV